MKKHFSLFLCLSMLAVSMAGCGGEGTETVQTATPLTETSVVTEAVILLQEADYAGVDFKILTAAEQWQQFTQPNKTVTQSTMRLLLETERLRNVTISILIIRCTTVILPERKLSELH